MSKREKLLWKFIHNPKNIQFHELETLLAHFGFQRVKTNHGSHMKWHHDGKNLSFQAPRKNPVKEVYIKAFIRILKADFNLNNPKSHEISQN